MRDIIKAFRVLRSYRNVWLTRIARKIELIDKTQSIRKRLGDGYLVISTCPMDWGYPLSTSEIIKLAEALKE